MVVARARQGGRDGLFMFPGTEKDLEMDGSDGDRTPGMYLLPLNSTEC